LTKGLEVFVGLATFVDSFYNGLLALTTACIERPGGRVDGILASLAAGTITQSSAACAVNLYGAGSNLELVGTEGMMWVVLRGEVVGESACGEMGGGSKRLGEVAAVAGEAGGRGAVGAFAAVEDLGEEAVWQSVTGRQSSVVSRRSSAVTCSGRGNALSDEQLEVALAVDLGGLEQAMGVAHVYRVGGGRLHVTQRSRRGAWAGRA
jgi:hypothetical protein